MKVRIKYSKTGYMKYIAHLDMLRYFQKAIRRSGIDIAYTDGFSPHQKVSFAAPLAVGMQSLGEYFDIEVNSSLDEETSRKLLDDTMVEGISVLNYKILPDNAGKCMSVCEASDYFVPYMAGEISVSDIQNIVDSFMSQNEIVVYRKTKCTEGEAEVKKYIYDMKAMEYEDYDGNKLKGVYMMLATGSVYNLKPEILAVKMGICDEEQAKCNIVRLETYRRDDEGDFVPLDVYE